MFKKLVIAIRDEIDCRVRRRQKARSRHRYDALGGGYIGSFNARGQQGEETYWHQRLGMALFQDMVAPLEFVQELANPA
ncbi:MAG: hypothetical protein Q7J84_07120 [Sulfuricaulis sp.]|nr:hypothetical protein [Sulfuricaulis sp.]